MDTSTKCPTKAQLRLHALSQLDTETAARMQDHLDQCDLCSETFNHLQSPLADTSPPEGDAAVSDLSDDGSQEDAAHDLIPPPVADVRAPIRGKAASDFRFLSPPVIPGDLGSLGTYRVLEVLGEGGMGIVFRAEDPKLQRPLALKVIRPELASHPQAKARFLREAQAIAAIDNDHIVSIYQVSDEAVPYLAMPLLKGRTLADRMRSEAPLTITESLRIAREVAIGLAAAHDRGVIHRDIKPANIWLELGSERVKLLDFGLARPTDGSSELTSTGAIAGTPLYMAPEQIAAAELDARADLYSLGCVLYRMLMSKPPLSAPTPLATLSAIATETPEPPRQVNQEIPEELSSLVMSLLEKSPDARPQSAVEVVNRIVQLEEAPSPRSSARMTEPSIRRWRTPAAARLAAVLLATAAIAVAAIVIRIKNKDGSETTIGVSTSQVAALTIEQDGKALADVKVNTKGKAMPAATVRGDAATPADRPSTTVNTDETKIKIGPPVTVAVKSITIEPEPLPFKQGEPLVKHALVAQPAPIDGVISWTIHSTNHRTTTPRSVVSPDGQYIASASMDMAIRIWEVETGRLIKLLLGHDHPLQKAYFYFSVCWSPDGKYLASASAENPLIIWDVASGRVLRRVTCPVANPDFMHWSPDGTRIVVTDKSQAHEGVVFDVEQSKASYTMSACSAAWSPDAKTLALGGNAGGVQFLEADSGKVLRTIKAHAGPVTRIGFTPDGRTLGTGTFENTLTAEGQEMALWDLASGASLRRREGQFFVTFSPDGTELMTGGMPASDTWQTATGELLGGVKVRGDVPGPVWLPDGNRVMTGSIPTIWDNMTGNQIRVFGYGQSGDARNYRFSADSRRLLHDYQAHTSLGTGLWELRPLRLVTVAMPGHMSIWSPDSSQFAHGDTLQAMIRDAASGELKLELTDSQGKRGTPTSAIVFSPDGKQVAKLNSGNDVSIVEIASGKTLQTLNTDTPPNHAAWRPHGDQIAIIGTDGIVQVRDLASGEVLHQLETDQTFWPLLAWSRDGAWLAVTGSHGPFTIWNVDTDEERVQSSGVFLTWMNEGSQYATSVGASVRIADAATGNQIRQVSQLPAGGSISPDGKLYVSSELHTNVFHSGEDGRLLGKVHNLTAHHYAPNIKYMIISPDGHWRGPNGQGRSVRGAATNLFVYVVQTAQGQETLTDDQFTEKYGWRNDPEKARILDLADAE